MIVEDDVTSRNALRMILARAGWEVTAVATVADALISLAHIPPNAVVLDLMLPDGDGVEVLRAIRSSGADARVVIVTGMHDPARLRQVEDLKPDCILRKPIDLATLITHLRA